MRLIGYLDAGSGAVHTEETSRVTASRLAKSVIQLSARYPAAERIYLVWDNWTVHAHPKVMEALRRQARLEVLWLPTYAPWLNPMEKGWRWGRQRVSHAHPWCDDFGEFRRQVCQEYASLAQGSQEFRRYVGLDS
jgi:transposase